MGMEFPRSLRSRRVVITIVVVVALAAMWHYWTLYRSVADARDRLYAAQGRLSDTGLDLTTQDLDRADGDLAAAASKLDSARFHMDADPFIRIAGIVPGLKTQVSGGRDMLEMADLLVATGREASVAGRKAVALRERPREGEAL